MSVLLRAGTLEGLPVVALAGERVAEIKDVVFDSGRGRLVGFTLRSPGLFSRARHDALPWTAVRGRPSPCSAPAAARLPPPPAAALAARVGACA
jgi:hypothetical protein